jgi:hypothetical protein
MPTTEMEGLMDIELTIQEADKLAEICENPWHANQLSNIIYDLLEKRESEGLSQVELLDYDLKIKII